MARNNQLSQLGDYLDFRSLTTKHRNIESQTKLKLKTNEELELQHILHLFFYFKLFVSFFSFFSFFIFNSLLKRMLSIFLLPRFFVSLPSTEALYRAPVLPLPVPSPRLPVSGPAVPKDRPALPKGSRKALVQATEYMRKMT